MPLWLIWPSNNRWLNAKSRHLHNLSSHEKEKKKTGRRDRLFVRINPLEIMKISRTFNQETCLPEEKRDEHDNGSG